MNFLRFPMFQRRGSNPPPPARHPYQSDSLNGPWERKASIAETTKRYVVYAFEPPSQPAPALLWQDMEKAWAAATDSQLSGGDAYTRQAYATEIEAVAEWLQLSESTLCSKRLSDLLKEQARLAREGNA